MKGVGLFAVPAPPAAPEEDEDDLAGDLAPLDSEESSEPEAPMPGPFDAYAETVFSDADTATKSDALRQAILCVLEERGGK